jgi:SAM-dependent MidA family methyltransferase
MMPERPRIDPDRPETWPASAREYLARRHSTAAHSCLGRSIREEIRERGPVTFARFMERALYDAERGYYTTAEERVGARGDYVTAPTTHPAFGALLGRGIAALWERLGRPDPFVVAEAGAGTGALAAQILAAGFGGALRYRIIEPFAVWREAQTRELSPWAARVARYRELEAQPGPPHVLLANELLDALPVHRVVRRAGGLRELYVAVGTAGALVEEEGPLSTVELEQYFERLGMMPPLDSPVEVSLAAVRWLRRALAATLGGWVWLLDYGAEAAELYSAPRAGTLRAFHGHALSTDALARVGAQDLTADVDFTTVRSTAQDEGWVVEQYTSQRELLLSLGLEEWLRPSSGVAGDPEGAMAGRWAALQLVDPGGMGAIRSLLLRDGRDCAGDGSERQ